LARSHGNVWRLCSQEDKGGQKKGTDNAVFSKFLSMALLGELLGVADIDGSIMSMNTVQTRTGKNAANNQNYSLIFVDRTVAEPE